MLTLGREAAETEIEPPYDYLRRNVPCIPYVNTTSSDEREC